MSNTMKRATAKDVAKEAGVSVATVSYIMNDRTDQKISPATRKKVLQIANLLNYVPSHAAKSLATGRSNAIGISYLINESPTRNASLMSFVNRLIERLNRLKYDVSFIPARNAGEGLPINRNIDAIIAIDLARDDFRSLADNYLVPVICVDMLVNDTLFYQIYEDVPFLVQKAKLALSSPEKCCLIYDSHGNVDYEEFILSCFGPGMLLIKAREATPEMLAGLKDSAFIIDGTLLALRVLPYIDSERCCVLSSDTDELVLPAGIKHLLNNDDKKANLTMSILMNALNRNFDVTHDHPVR